MELRKEWRKEKGEDREKRKSDVRILNIVLRR
jgi:hypothetical protein